MRSRPAECSRYQIRHGIQPVTAKPIQGNGAKLAAAQQEFGHPGCHLVTAHRNQRVGRRHRALVERTYGGGVGVHAEACHICHAE
ncbi:Uncharacterised protein [Mycobacteroides abscessus subsp. abscessus]|nr:Uncharacterised protein [Mycobacteroides abscessus subsp. abscessus]